MKNKNKIDCDPYGNEHHHWRCKGCNKVSLRVTNSKPDACPWCGDKQEMTYEGYK
jgi:hypothetical protein